VWAGFGGMKESIGARLRGQTGGVSGAVARVGSARGDRREVRGGNGSEAPECGVGDGGLQGEHSQYEGGIVSNGMDAPTP